MNWIAILKYLAPFLAVLRKVPLKAALKLALDVVRQYAGESLTNEAKRRAAAALIKKVVAANFGVELPDAAVNFLLELAVQALKKEQKEAVNGFFRG